MLLREGEVRIPSGCAISGIIDRKKTRFSGEDIIKSIAMMHERSNGLGGGFCAYGIYPEYKEYYAFHMFFEDTTSQQETEVFLRDHFVIKATDGIPTKKIKSINNIPIIWRYFVRAKEELLINDGLSEDEFVVQCVLKINRGIKGSFVASSGKNMGAFKAVGYPEDVGEFYRLDDYKGYIWTAHGRFPTNTPGWWGGAHPFTLLDWSVVHNGELSSYGTNKRYLEEFGYECTLQTDTEVALYMFDLLIRRFKLSFKSACSVIAPPFWDQIERMDEAKKEVYKNFRIMYSKAMLNGPFSIILGFTSGILALNDRIKLRPLVAAEKDDRSYISSEESAIRTICPNPDRMWTPRGGEPVIVRVEED